MAAVTGDVAQAAAEATPTKKDDKDFGWKDLLLWCGIPILVMVLLRIFVVGMYVIPSGSMENTIMPGNRVIISKLTPALTPVQRGDIIVFKDPAGWLRNEQSGMDSDNLIKRVIGLPGDVVECDGGGAPIKINGVAINESSYIKPGTEPSMFPFKVTVTPDHLFVLGDNRNNSLDSRYHQDDGDHGFVPISDVKGVAFMRYWPLNQISTLTSHHDVFANVPNPGSSTK
nr:signal peptidase I [Bifidobacterium dolichotidis]